MSKPGNPWEKQGPTPIDDGANRDESAVERLLRAALEARADEVGVHDLRPATPPRGNGRRTRPLYTVALPLIGLAAAGAVGYLGFHGTADLADRQSAPAATAPGTVTAGPTASSGTGPSPTPSSTGNTPPATSTTPSGNTPSSGAAATGTPSGGGANAVSGQYLPATWLAPSEYPLDSVFHWTSTGRGIPINTTGPFQWLYTCGSGSPTVELHTASISTLNFKASTHVGKQTPQQANEVMLFFKDAATARTAMAAIENDYTGCAGRNNATKGTGFATGKPVTWTVTRTATSASGFAYRVQLRAPDGTPDSGPNVGTDAQELFVRSGNVVTLAQLQAGGTEIDPAGDAPQVLAAMAARLAAFPQ